MPYKMVYCITLGLVRDQVLALKNCEITIEVSATALIYLVRSVQWSCSLYYLSNLSQKTSVAKKKKNQGEKETDDVAPTSFGLSIPRS